MNESDYDDTLNYRNHTAAKLLLAIVFSLLSVVMLESVAGAHLLDAPKTGFGLFGRNVPPPSGAASSSLRDLFVRNAESPFFRGRVDLWNKLSGKSPVNWDDFMTRLRSSDFNDYATWNEARKSLGFANSGPNGWLFGLAKPLRQIPGIRGSAARHELFHAIDDLTTGLFGQPKTLGLWFRAEAGAHIIGGPLIGVVGIPGLTAGSIYVGWWITGLGGDQE